MGNKDLELEEFLKEEEKSQIAPISVDKCKYRILVVRIDRSLSKRMKDKMYPSDILIYRSTKEAWVVNIERASKVDFVVAQFGGKVQKVFVPEKWYKHKTAPTSPDRYGFDGDILRDEKILNEILFSDISQDLTISKGSTNPIKYINLI